MPPSGLSHGATIRTVPRCHRHCTAGPCHRYRGCHRPRPLLAPHTGVTLWVAGEHCNMAHCHPWYTITHDPLSPMAHYHPWHTALSPMAQCHPWHNVTHGTLSPMAQCHPWHTINHDTLSPMVHYNTGQTANQNTLAPMSHDHPSLSEKVGHSFRIQGT